MMKKIEYYIMHHIYKSYEILIKKDSVFLNYKNLEILLNNLDLYNNHTSSK